MPNHQEKIKTPNVMMGVNETTVPHHSSISTLRLQVADGCELVSNRSLYGAFIIGFKTGNFNNNLWNVGSKEYSIKRKKLAKLAVLKQEQNNDK